MTNKTLVTFILLDDGTSVRREFYDRIQRQIEEVLPAVDPDSLWDVKLLCGPDFWKTLTTYQKILAGKCMSHMVRHGKLPFVPAGRPCRTPKGFRLI